jgi:hypothetical protein
LWRLLARQSALTSLAVAVGLWPPAQNGGHASLRLCGSAFSRINAVGRCLAVGRLGMMVAGFDRFSNPIPAVKPKRQLKLWFN